MGRTRTLAASGAIAQSQVDADRTQLETAEKEVESLRAQIARKELHAPFSGRLGIRTVNLGQYLNAGTAITTLQTEKALFVDFTTPQEKLGMLAIGMPVRIESGPQHEATSAEKEKKNSRDAGAEEAQQQQQQQQQQQRHGVIDAIEPAVDAATRTVKVRASVTPSEADAKEGDAAGAAALRPGMFVRATVILAEKNRVVVVPATAIVHASFGDSVFVIEDKPPGSPGMQATPDGKPVKVVRQQFVRPGETRGDFIAIVEGVQPNQELVTAGAFKLRNGSPVVVNNDAQPKPELDPHPQNR